MNKLNTKIISFLLIFVFIFNFFTPYMVFAGDDDSSSGQASQVQADFLNFWSQGVNSLSMDETTSTDYYVLSAFMSNFYNPGVTTLDELLNPENSEFFKTFSTTLGKSGDSSLVELVKKIGTDTISGIESGKCTLVNKSGNLLTGTEFVNKIVDSIPNVSKYNDGDFISSEIYYENSNNLAFDLSAPAVRTAFQVLNSYNPKLFFTTNGIYSLNAFFIDNVGNVWGVKDSSGVIKNKNMTGVVSQIGAENIYLILPSCLNPSAFSPKVGKGNQDALRMPIMNRFCLGLMASESDFGGASPKFTQEHIPYYNLLSVSNNASSLTKIFGLHTVSSQTMNSGNFFNGGSLTSWGNKKQDLAFFAHDPNFFAVSLKNQTGISQFATNSFIVLSPDISQLTGISGNKITLNDKTGNRTLDLSEMFGTSKAFDILDKDLEKQKQLLFYMYSPTMLTLNQVSMQVFMHSDSAIEDKTAAFGEELYSSNLSEAEIVAAKAGVVGLSLFFSTDGQEVDLDDELYKGLVPDKIYNSKFVNSVGNPGTPAGVAVYRAVQSGNKQSIEDAINYDTALKHILKTSLFSDVNLKINNLEAIGTGTLIESGFVSESNINGITQLNIKAKPEGFINIGNNTNDISISRTATIKDYGLLKKVDSLEASIDNSDEVYSISTTVVGNQAAEALFALFGYSVFLPSDAVTAVVSGGNLESLTTEYKLLGSNESFKPGIPTYKMNNQDFIMGMYFAYIIDMMGISNLTPATDSKPGSIQFNDFGSPYLPKYNISAKGGSMDIQGDGSAYGSGLVNSEDSSFEEKQKDLINRIYGLTNDSNNDYRNRLIQNILEGFLLTTHRTITGTWTQDVGTITTGNTSTYQSVAGFIYTPTLEELSFTATLMNNYIKIYVLCMLLILFIMILMVLLHMRTWQQGLFISLVMSVALLFPYILISNSINISNKISDSVYSDRFDFWAMTQQQQSLKSLNSTIGMNEKDTLLTISSATMDKTYAGDTGVKIKWMSPKKTEMFNNLYSDKSLSESFVTNIQIYKWLFNSFIYDSEFVDTDIYGSYLYRPYNSIAAEAKAYYAWGGELSELPEFMGSESITMEGYPFTGLPKGYAEGLKDYDNVNEKELNGGKIKYLAGLIRVNRSNWDYYSSDVAKLSLSQKRLEDLNKISSLDKTGIDEKADIIGLWGSLDETITARMLGSVLEGSTAGIVSNLPMTESENSFEGKDYKEISRAIYLKNTESPFYYFYSVLRMRYDENSEDGSFRKQLLENDMYKVSKEEEKTLNFEKKVSGAYRDFLDLEGLFTYVIPYLKEGNDYVQRWQSVNGDNVDEYNFEYQKDETTGEEVLIIPDTETDSMTYQEAANKKRDMNHVWNMYSPWVDSLYDLDIYNKRVTVGKDKVVIQDTLNPSYYIKEGRPMIFSEADMLAKSYNYSELTDVERRIQSVLEKTYTDMLYLVNYYDLDNEVLITAAAMYATFHFNEEFSKDSFIGESVMLYPQCFELKNFNYDAYMRLALLNATGESVFATDDLYTRVLSKTSIFTGLLLLVCDAIACIAIPMMKFVIVVGLLFLGVLICIACVVNPPDKIFESVMKSLLLPTVLFMSLNIAFAWIMSFIVGEGLTAYVGSKSVNFATNDPTITILLMGVLGVGYLFCAWKILKLLVEAYKEFGVGTAIAAVGIVGSALAAGTAGVAKKGLKLLDDTGSGILGMGVGAVTAGRGNRLAGAYEGARRGTRGILDQRIREQRTRRDLGGLSLSNSRAITSSIDAKASSNKDEVAEKSKLSYNDEYQNLINEEKKLGADPESSSTTLSRGVNKLNRLKHRATDAFNAIGSGVNSVKFTATHLPEVVSTGFKKGYNSAGKYFGKSLTDVRLENDRLDEVNKVRRAKRNYERFEYKKKIVSSEDSKREILQTESGKISSEDRVLDLENAKVTLKSFNDRKVVRMTGVVDKGKKEG